MTAVDVGTVRSAETVAAESAARAGVVVRRVEDLDEIRAVTELFAEVWATSPDTLMPVGILRALHHARSYTAGAFRGNVLVGAGVGFLSDADAGGRRHLHSHIVGVRPGEQGRSVGYAVKQDQRAWALARGLHEIQWTFDPLVRRNAWFNLVKLHSIVGDYYPDFYGPMDDGINAGEPTDRGLVRWFLHPTEVVSDNGRAAPRLTAADVTGSVVLRVGDRGQPVSSPATADVRLCQVPEDIVALRAEAPELSAAWRLAVREVFMDAIAAGLTASSMTVDGFYVFTSGT